MGAPSRASILPERSRPLIGRSADHARALELIRKERAIALIGPGGVGKTSLAVALSDSINDEDAPVGGVWFCDLSSVRTTDAAVAAVARTLGIDGVDGAQRADRIGAALAAREETLLVLDNVEQLLPAFEPALVKWLADAPQMRLLATSRQAFNTDDIKRFDIAPLVETAALELFRARATKFRPNALDAAEDTAAAVEIVRALDGIPLAIELAAGAVEISSVRVVAKKLASTLDVVNTASGSPERHRTARAAVEWSLDLLDGVERDALIRLTVFEGSFSAEGAERVVGSSADRSIAMLLRSLRNKSLLWGEQDAFGEVRLRLYQPVREVAYEAFEKRADAAAIRARCREHYVAEAERLGVLVRGRDPAPALLAVATDLDGFLATCDDALKSGDGVVAARITLALDPFFRARGPFRTFKSLVDRVLTSELPPNLRARIMASQGHLLRLSSDDTTASKVLDEAIAIAEKCGDPLAVAETYLQRGVVAYNVNDHALSRSCSLKSRAIADQHGFGYVRAFADVMTAYSEIPRGELVEADGRIHDALRPAIRGEEPRILDPVMWLVRADVAHRWGAPELAESHLRVAVERARELRELRLEGLCSAVLAAALRDQHREGDAQEQYARAEQILNEAGNRGIAAEVAFQRATSSLAVRDLDAARNHANRCLQYAMQSETKLQEVDGHAVVGAIEAAAGNFGSAELAFARARACFDNTPHSDRPMIIRLLETVLMTARAVDARRAGRDKDAETAIAAARAILDKEDSERPSHRSVHLERWSAFHAARAFFSTADAAASARRDAKRLEIGPRCEWFSIDGAPRVDLRNHGLLRRLLARLVDERRANSIRGVPVSVMATVGWRDRTASPTALAARVYTAINRLRGMGLEHVVLRMDDGYVIDPNTEVVATT